MVVVEAMVVVVAVVVLAAAAAAATTALYIRKHTPHTHTPTTQQARLKAVGVSHHPGQMSNSTAYVYIPE